jgi:hypothetical protein
MGVDYEACLMYGVMFPSGTDPQKLLGLSDVEFEKLVDGVYKVSIEWASGYDDNGCVLYICDSLTRISRHDAQLIQPIETKDMYEQFWSHLGPFLTQKVKDAGKSPSWMLMFRLC